MRWYVGSFLIGLMVLLAAPASAQVYVDGYMRGDGTYVQPHWRSAPNNTPTDNYSYPGNTNPYTGQTAPQGRGLYGSSPYGSGNSYGGSSTLGSPSQPLGGGGTRGRSCVGLLCN